MASACFRDLPWQSRSEVTCLDEMDLPVYLVAILEVLAEMAAAALFAAQRGAAMSRAILRVLPFFRVFTRECYPTNSIQCSPTEVTENKPRSRS